MAGFGQPPLVQLRLRRARVAVAGCDEPMCGIWQRSALRMVEDGASGIHSGESERLASSECPKNHIAEQSTRLWPSVEETQSGSNNLCILLVRTLVPRPPFSRLHLYLSGLCARLQSSSGTSTSQVLDISRDSLKRRPPESICYPNLLRENGHHRPGNPEGPAICGGNCRVVCSDRGIPRAPDSRGFRAGLTHRRCAASRSVTKAGRSPPDLRDQLASMMLRMRVARASIAKGLVIIDMPGSRKPFAIVAFSA